MRSLFICLSLFLFAKCLGQENLILNGSFEDTISCPLNIDRGYEALELAKYWTKPTDGTPDFYHRCANTNPNAYHSLNIPVSGVPQNSGGNIEAKDGNAYAGIFLYSKNFPNSGYREYLEGELSVILKKGKKYLIQCYVAVAYLNSCIITDNLGFYFLSEKIRIRNPANGGDPFSSYYHNLPYSPQVINSKNNFLYKTDWMRVSGEFISSGSEKFIIIGNFSPDSLTDTISINSPNINCISNGARNAYLYIDDVSLVCLDCETVSFPATLEAASIRLYPNPTQDKVRLSGFVGAGRLELRDGTGALLFSELVNPSPLQGGEQSSVWEKDISLLPTGIYFWRLVSSTGQETHGKLSKN